MLCKMIPLKEGVLVQYVGVYITKWGNVSEPEYGFVEIDKENIDFEDVVDLYQMLSPEKQVLFTELIDLGKI